MLGRFKIGLTSAFLISAQIKTNFGYKAHFEIRYQILTAHYLLHKATNHMKLCFYSIVCELHEAKTAWLKYLPRSGLRNLHELTGRKQDFDCQLCIPQKLYSGLIWV